MTLARFSNLGTHWISHLTVIQAQNGVNQIHPRGLSCPTPNLRLDQFTTWNGYTNLQADFPSPLSSQWSSISTLSFPSNGLRCQNLTLTYAALPRLNRLRERSDSPLANHHEDHPYTFLPRFPHPGLSRTFKAACSIISQP